MRQLLLYLPVIHAGYEALIERTRPEEILVLGVSFQDRFRELRKDVRALNPDHAVRYLRSRWPGINIFVVEAGDLARSVREELIVPNEAIMHELVEQALRLDGDKVVFDQSFLRWTREATEAERTVNPDHEIAIGDVPHRFMGLAVEVSQASPDWWRQVGAVLVLDDVPLVYMSNQHWPSPYESYMAGDPRSNYSRGNRIDMSLALHAELAVIAECARHAVPTQGASLYVNVFPCPTCAYAIAAAGITTLYYAGGYAMLDGDKILRDAGVTLIHVNMTNPPS